MKYTSDTKLFAHKDYRLALKSRADSWKQAVPAATFQALAKACRVQKAYLSRVFQQQADLSHDQMYLACEHLGITNFEREFILNLHDYCRSDVEARRRDLKVRLDQIRYQALDTLSHVSVEPIKSQDSDRLASFFLDPEAQLVHSYLVIESYRKQPMMIATAIGISQARLEQIFENLRRLNLLTANDDGLQVTNSYLHLPSDSVIFQAYRSLLRQRVLAEQTRRMDRKGYAFSLLFTADKQVEAAMRGRLLAALKEFEADVRAAPSEEVYFLGIDLMPWS